MYKSLFIDLDDTLWAFTENACDCLEEAYILFGLKRYFDTFDYFYSLYKESNTRLWREYGDGKITKEELNRHRFSFPLEAVGVSDTSLAEAYSGYFLETIPTKSKLMPFVKEALDYLAPKYRLFILSNGFRELQSRKMHSAGIDCYFEKVILSEDLLIHKPHPEIFHFALSATQSQMKESLMIGDNWEADIVGAKAAGIHQMYYHAELPEDLSFYPTFHLNSWNNIQNTL